MSYLLFFGSGDNKVHGFGSNKYGEISKGHKHRRVFA